MAKEIQIRPVARTQIDDDKLALALLMLAKTLSAAEDVSETGDGVPRLVPREEAA